MKAARLSIPEKFFFCHWVAKLSDAIKPAGCQFCKADGFAGKIEIAGLDILIEPGAFFSCKPGVIICWERVITLAKRSGAE